MSAGDFSGRVALVTGAARGIGRATASLLARRGARVVLFDPDPQVEAAAADIRAAGAAADAVRGSVTDEADLACAVEVAAAAGGLDILVNNAGISHDAQRLADTPLEIWRRVLAINLEGALLAARAALPLLRRSPAAAIVSVASHGGIVPIPNKGAYSVSKAALHMLTMVLAVEEAPHGVRVNAIAPGPIETPMTGYIQTNQAVRDLVLQQIPLGRLGTPEETAELIAFLASDEARFVTGAVVPITGGMLALPQGPGSPFQVTAAP